MMSKITEEEWKIRLINLVIMYLNGRKQTCKKETIYIYLDEYSIIIQKEMYSASIASSYPLHLYKKLNKNIEIFNFSNTGNNFNPNWSYIESISFDKLAVFNNIYKLLLKQIDNHVGYTIDDDSKIVRCIYRHRNVKYEELLTNSYKKKVQKNRSNVNLI